jgi:hypothetical protein
VNYPSFRALEDAAKSGIISRQAGLLEKDLLHRFQSMCDPAGKHSMWDDLLLWLGGRFSFFRMF